MKWFRQEVRERIDICRHSPASGPSPERSVTGRRIAWSAKVCGRLVLVVLLYTMSLAVIGTLNMYESGTEFAGPGTQGLTWRRVLLSLALLALLWLCAKRPVGLVSRFLGAAAPFKDGLMTVLAYWAAWLPIALLCVAIVVVSGSVEKARQTRASLSKPPGKTLTSYTFPDGDVVEAYSDETSRPERITVRRADGTGEECERRKDGTWAHKDLIFTGSRERQDRRQGTGIQTLYAGVFTAPIFEEIIFRGVLYLLMLRPLGRIGAGIGTALLFFGAHLSEGVLDSPCFGMIATALSCYLLTSLLLGTKRLTWCIMFHLMMNGTALTLQIVVRSFGRYLQ